MTKKELELKVQQLELELAFVKGQIQALQLKQPQYPYPSVTNPATPNLPWTVTC